jgi:outer membrane protein assembly factor BamA
MRVVRAIPSTTASLPSSSEIHSRRVTMSKGRLPRLRDFVGRLLCVLAVLDVATPTAAAVDEYIGKPIESVHVTIEGRETTDATLVSVLETRVGQPLSMAAVRESIAHLYSLGRFDDVRVDATAVGEVRVALRYELSPLHPITSIKFAGKINAPGVDTGQMRQAVVSRYGTSPSFGRAEELTQVVIDLLRQRGYLRPDVQPQAEFAHAPDRATLVFTIDPGPRAIIGSIEIAGPPTVSRPTLLDRLGLSEGAVYNPETLDARIERYVAEQRKEGFYESKLVATPTVLDDGRRVNLTLTVTPGSHVRVVFTGDPLPADRRADLVPIEREGSVDEDLLEDSTNRIEDYFRAQGYRDARAPHRRIEQ